MVMLGNTSKAIIRLCLVTILFNVGIFSLNASAESILDPSVISVSAFGSEWWEFGPVQAVYDGRGLVNGQHDTAMPNSWGAGNYPSVIPVNGINQGNACMNYAQFTFDQAYSPLIG